MIIVINVLGITSVICRPPGSCGLHTGFEGVPIRVVPGSFPSGLNVEQTFLYLSGLGVCCIVVVFDFRNTNAFVTEHYSYVTWSIFIIIIYLLQSQ